MRLSSILSASTAALVLGAGSAMAGGVIAPVIEAAPVAVTPVAPVAGAWQGAYAGGSLGYSFGGDDEVGLDLIGPDGETLDRATNLGNVKLSGATAGLHVGYRWQRDRWVFGPELAIEGGSVKDDITVSVIDPEDGPISGNIESKLKNTISLVAKTGYAIDPQTLIFGTFGVSRYNGEYRISGDGDSETVSYNTTGLTAGFGVERMISDTMSVFGAYEYRDFGRSDVDFDAEDGDVLRSIATPKHSNVKVGINFRF